MLPTSSAIIAARSPRNGSRFQTVVAITSQSIQNVKFSQHEMAQAKNEVLPPLVCHRKFTHKQINCSCSTSVRRLFRNTVNFSVPHKKETERVTPIPIYSCSSKCGIVQNIDSIFKVFSHKFEIRWDTVFSGPILYEPRNAGRSCSACSVATICSKTATHSSGMIVFARKIMCLVDMVAFWAM